MKLMKDMTRDEVMELFAATVLRIYGFDFALNAFHHLLHLQHYLSPSGSYAMKNKNLTTDYTIHNYIIDIAFDSIMSLVFFILTIPLARLVCRGLSRVLGSKPVE